MGKGQDRRAPPVHDFGTIGAEVRYVGPPPEYRDTGIQAAAGEGISPLTEDSSSVPVPSDRVRGSDVMAVRIRGNSMLGAGISNGDDVIVRRQQTAEDGDIVLISIWESGDSVGSANVKRFHQQEGVAQLVSEYEDRQEKEPFQPERHRIVGKVIGTFHPMP
jgi:repressor LexA